MLIELLVRVITSPYLVEYSLLAEVSFVVIKEKKIVFSYSVIELEFVSLIVESKEDKWLRIVIYIEYRVVATTDARHLGYIFLYGIIAPIME